MFKNLSKEIKYTWYLGSLFSLSLLLFQALNQLPWSIYFFSIFFILLVIISYFKYKLVFLSFLFLVPFIEFIISPSVIPFNIRPFQFIFLAFLIGYIIKILNKKSSCKTLFLLKKYDYFFLLIGVFSIISIMFFPEDSFRILKNTSIYFSFVLMYLVTRNLCKNKNLFFESIHTLIFSSLIVSGWAFLELIMIKFQNTFEPPVTFSGRPDSVLFEPDWLGFYNIFIISLIINLKFSFLGSKRFFKDWFINFLLFLNIFVLIFSFTRSAWISLFSGLFLFIIYPLLVFFIVKLPFIKYISSFIKFENIKISKIKIILNSYFKKIILPIIVCVIFSIIIGSLTNISKISLKDRFLSISGKEKITVAINPKTKKEYWINIENIKDWENHGYYIEEKYRKDINFEKRETNYYSDLNIIKDNLFISKGFGYNKVKSNNYYTATNIFYEILITSGFFGFLSFLCFFVFWFLSIKNTFFSLKNLKITTWVLSSLCMLLIPNIFNNGFFLSFCWIWLAILISVTIHSYKKT